MYWKKFDTEASSFLRALVYTFLDMYLVNKVFGYILVKAFDSRDVTSTERSVAWPSAEVVRFAEYFRCSRNRIKIIQNHTNRVKTVFTLKRLCRSCLKSKRQTFRVNY